MYQIPIRTHLLKVKVAKIQRPISFSWFPQERVLENEIMILILVTFKYKKMLLYMYHIGKTAAEKIKRLTMERILCKLRRIF